jgi:hypothetical protein
MISALARKTRQLRADPVLRRWLLRRLVRREPPSPAFVEGRPPYLDAAAFPADARPVWSGASGHFGKPSAPIAIVLAGETVELSPDDPGALFARRYGDLETELSAHRFAWLPLAGASVDPDWTNALWRAWAERFGDRAEGWPWHPYTAAERAINILDFAERHGLPGDRDATLALLAHHAEAIAGSLEYYGDHYTSNHLSNDGRGLLRIGCACGLPDHAALGARIMVAEAGRIFGRSGLLREGSSHYHLLLTRNYVDAWAAAQAAGLPEAGMLRDIALRALGAVPALYLPGGLPLIGDISPDCPPAFLRGLRGAAAPGDEDGPAWPALRTEAPRARVERLIAEAVAVSPDRLAVDGWHRFGAGDWAALAYVPPDGWPPMPGHGHLDLGGFELHDGPTRVLVDPARGSYGDDAAAAWYVSADAHNTLTVDGHAASPVNRPYYRDSFRRLVVPGVPEVRRTRDGLRLVHQGFARRPGVGVAQRDWRFASGRVEIRDRIEGSGRHRIRRTFFTPSTATVEENSARFGADGASYKLHGDAAATVATRQLWSAYGTATPGTEIVFETDAVLPFDGIVTLERA